MNLTSHGSDRIGKRMGINKKSRERQANLALDRGLKHSDFTGSLGRYLDGLFLKHNKGNNMRIYNNEVFIFHNESLITVIPIPSKYQKVVKKVLDKNK